ncbi:hypothetical protein H8R02_25370 [Ramlibacter sp. GTP1]|uniref:Ava_C0101 and related proteins n=1 Tax=Ramlibacter albus TaxID=2079448 RepID=A0A923MBL8_9BURK|nr:hypothetical protein [Ramlibacter albus]
MVTEPNAHANWPPLVLDEWEPTYLTVHRFTQVLGKLCLGYAPPQNHWWHSALAVTSRGLTTQGLTDGARMFSVTLDFCRHRLEVHCSDGAGGEFPLEGLSVADFWTATLETLAGLGIRPELNPVPAEVADRTPLNEDRKHAAYDRGAITRLHRILVLVDNVFRIHRGGFLGKSSPVHFFWGAFDLAVSRFCGTRNPQPPQDPMMAAAYSHEVISHGFWPGGDWPGSARVPEAVFYAYVVPAAQGLESASVVPSSARFDAALGEFILPYEEVRKSAAPRAALLQFMETTYRAAATLRGWDTALLER